MSPLGATAVMRAFFRPVANAFTVKPGGAFSAAMRSGVASTLLGFQTLILVENWVPSPCWAAAVPNARQSAAASETRFMGDAVLGHYYRKYREESCQCLHARYGGKRTLSKVMFNMQQE